MTAIVHRNHVSVQIWLIACLFLVAAMVLVGGYTRLSGSGLSITEWAPIHGVIPPMNSEEWQEEFDAYRASPQYQKINKGMSLDEFKTIYWPEYWHRILGRAIGMVFLFPLIYFALNGTLGKRFGWRLFGIFALGGLQGLFGWLMVKSGLQDDPYVSHLKLALHLSTAFLLFSLLLWALLDLISSQKPAISIKLATSNWQPATYKIWFALLWAQIILGAFVAGQHGGLVYNTWPTMNGDWLPPDLINPHAVWHENITLVQFLHRKLAILLCVGYGLWWFFARSYVKNNALGKASAAVALIMLVQFALGVFTLIYHVPLNLALAHQMTALALLGVSVWLLYGVVRISDELRIIIRASYRPAQG
ncbi:MAG: COX15/CtaA family protein [Rickettsiales bacterium]|jgi:cytochrome c oxidase assembly protein subunit 15|nr:COX15/CtaA family protein [Rickettsiales bacterium]